MAQSKRFEYLSSFYEGEGSVYDIGCDHGLLGLSFLSNPNITDVYLIDPNPYSVDIIKGNIDSYITKGKNIYPLRCSGEETKVQNSNSLIYIAGMGGKTIIEILSNWSEESLQNASQIVVSPHRNQLELRAFLRSIKMNVVKEGLVFEGAHYYEVISVSRTKGNQLISEYGDEIWQTPMAANYLKHQVKFLQKHRDEESLKYLNFLNALGK